MPKSQIGHPGHNATVVQTRAAVRYILASQAAVHPDDWEKIVGMAVKDAMSKKPAIRSEARRFLKSLLMPSDPIAMLGQFLTDVTLEQIKERIEFLRGQKDQVQAIDVSVVEESGDGAKGSEGEGDPEQESEPH